jgi:hypothetical protein
MPSPTAPPGLKIPTFDEPHDELSLLQDWCAEVTLKREDKGLYGRYYSEPYTSSGSWHEDRRGSVPLHDEMLPDLDFVEVTNLGLEFVALTDDALCALQMDEPMEIGEPLGKQAKGGGKGSRSVGVMQSIRGHDTASAPSFPEFGSGSIDESAATIKNGYGYLEGPSLKARPRLTTKSDPCVPPVILDRLAASSTSSNAPTQRPESGTTTFMLRNIPNRVKVEDIQDRISSLGFGDTFDFLYMPLDLQSKQNKGYAFVNLMNETVAADFQRRFSGVQFEGRLSTKEVLVCKAAAQGVVPTLRTIKHSNWSKKEHMPIVRVEGKLMHLTPLAACEILRIKEHYG